MVIVVLTIAVNPTRFLFCFIFVICFFYRQRSLFCFTVQRAFYFSIKERLKALFRIPGYRGLLNYEYFHFRLRSTANIMTDIYDGTAWQTFMGPPTYPCSRIGLQGCTDGFQAYNTGSTSLKPLMFANMSLPPALRFRTKHMLLSMLLPINSKSYGQKKYYDFAATEFNILYQTGLNDTPTNPHTLPNPTQHQGE